MTDEEKRVVEALDRWDAAESGSFAKGDEWDALCKALYPTANPIHVSYSTALPAGFRQPSAARPFGSLTTGGGFLATITSARLRTRDQLSALSTRGPLAHLVTDAAHHREAFTGTAVENWKPCFCGAPAHDPHP